MRLLPERLLYDLLERPGDLPLAGNDRWGSVKQFGGRDGSGFTFINTGMLPIVTAMALQIEFSTDGALWSPNVPIGYSANVTVEIIRAVDVKSGPFLTTLELAPGGSPMPFCTLIARALTVSLKSQSEAGPLFGRAVACPTEMMDCADITGENGTWNDVQTVAFPANHVGVFIPVLADTGTRQLIIQNNTATDLLLGFGATVPSNGPPPVSNMILPGGIHAIWESDAGSFVGKVSALFKAVGSATEFATFTRGINT